MHIGLMATAWDLWVPERRSGLLGGFNWSSQQLECEGLRWEQASVIGQYVRCEGRCGRLVGRRDGGVSIGSGSGKASRAGCRARTRSWRPGCRLPSEPVGSERVAGWHRSRSPRCRGVVCRSLSGRRSRSCTRSTTGFVGSLDVWAGLRRRSRGSYAATRPPVVAIWSFGPRPHSGTPTAAPDAPRSPSSQRTTRCVSTCRTASPV